MMLRVRANDWPVGSGRSETGPGGAIRAIGLRVSGARSVEIAYFSAVVLSVVPFGAVYPVLSALVCGCFSILLAVAQVLPQPGDAIARLTRRLMVLVAGLLAWVVLQAWQFQGNIFANPIWSEAGLSGPRLAGAISVNPGETWQALVTLATPGFAVLAGLRIFADTRAAFRLWRFLAAFTAALVAITLIQHVMLPRTVLIYERWAYIGDYTLTFVIRNSAATAVGMALLINAALLLCSLQTVRWSRFWQRLIAFDDVFHTKYGGLLRDVGTCFLIFVALILTRSRGGVAATVVGLLTLGSIVAVSNRQVEPNLRRTSVLLRMGAIAVVVLVAVWLFGGLALERVAQDGFEDIARLCTYGSIVRAIADHWLLGWGFGTFADVFPRYREAACSGIGGVWDRAHNSYLEFVLGTGVVGIIVIITAVWLVVATLVGGIRRRRALRYLPAAALAIVVLVATHALVDFSLQIPGVAVLLAALLASGLAISYDDPI